MKKTKKACSVLLATAMVVSSTPSSIGYATNVADSESGYVNDVVLPVTVEDADAVMKSLYEEMTKAIPTGQTVASFSNNYQTGEPEPMIFRSGTGTETIASGKQTVEALTVGNPDKFIATWEKEAYLSGGYIDITYQVGKPSEKGIYDSGIIFGSSELSSGLALRYESKGNWILQPPVAGGEGVPYKVLTAENVEDSTVNTGEDIRIQAGYYKNRLVVYINGNLLHDADISETFGDILSGGSLGQIGLYSRNPGIMTVSKINIQGVGSKVAPSMDYRQDYENITNEDLKWSANTTANIVSDDMTGNKILQIKRNGGGERVVDLNSPKITNGTLSLDYKLLKFQSGIGFGFRYSDDGSKFNELGCDGAYAWIPESHSGWGSNLGLPKPKEGAWNNLLINFEGKKITIYLNKELVGQTTFDKFTEDTGRFGFRLRGATELYIDNLIYTNQIVKPEEFEVYENNFEDKVTGNWTDATTKILSEGSNKLLKIEHAVGKDTSMNEDSIEIANGTFLIKTKSSDSNMGLLFGGSTIKWDGTKWVFVGVDGTSHDLTGEAEAPKVNKWNKIGISFDKNLLTLSINGKKSTLSNDVQFTEGKFGIYSAQDLYVDDIVYTEQGLDVDTTIVEDKLYYEEYYESSSVPNYDGLTESATKDGYLTGKIAANASAINKDITEVDNGMYQVKFNVDATKAGVQLGNTKVYYNGSAWVSKVANGEEVTIGGNIPVVESQNIIIAIKIQEKELELRVNNQLIGTTSVENYNSTGGFGIYNPMDKEVNVSVDAVAAEELRIYNSDYSKELNWKKLSGGEPTHTLGTNNSVIVTLPGVVTTMDDNSISMLDQKVSFDFSSSVDASIEKGGRYGFMLRAIDEKNYISIVHDVNGKWSVQVDGNSYEFPVAFIPEIDKTYHVEISLIGQTVILSMTDEAGETTELGSVTESKIPRIKGKFGLRSWFGTKNLTISNVKMIEVSTLPIFNADIKEETLQKGNFKVTMDQSYPRVLKYELNGKQMLAQEESIKTVSINGVNYLPIISYSKENESTAIYTMKIAEIDVTITAKMQIEDKNVLHFQVTNIEDPNKTIKTFGMTDNKLAYMDSKQTEDVSYAFTRIDGEWHGVYDETGNSIEDIEKNAKEGTTKAMMVGNGLGISIENNVMSGGNKFIVEKYKNSLIKKLSMSNGIWTYRHQQLDTEEQLPWFKVVLTEDQNNDGKVDWQDAAVAYRDNIYTRPFEAEEQKNNAMWVAFNFASQANDRFLNTLDTGKAIYNFTDGFGQMVLHKGYQAEGHDDDIPSYSNIGVRQGGVEDMKTMISEGHKYNMKFGVHLNATEYHLDANELMYENLNGSASGKIDGGWDWIDAAHYVDQTKDLLSGELERRFKSLYDTTKNDDGTALDFYYIDVYTGNDYNAYKLIEMVNKMGVKVGTEFAGPLDPGVSFLHWTNDTFYPNKGNKSVLDRIIRNDQDIFKNCTLLKGQQMLQVSSWGDSKPDMQNGVLTFYNEVLPSKYMQHYDILKWEDDQITFKDNVVSKRNHQTKRIELSKNGNIIAHWKDAGNYNPDLGGGEDESLHLSESTLLIPWIWDIQTNNILTKDTGAKLYHWNPDGGTTEWTITDEFAGVTSFDMYELTQQGKENKQTITVNDGKVVINAKSETAYVLYPSTSQALVESTSDWGSNSAVHDFAFNGESVDGTNAWKSSGDNATVETVPGVPHQSSEIRSAVANWNKYAQINGTGSLSQDLDFNYLEAGQDYTISVWTEVPKGQKSILEVQIGDKTYSNYVTGIDGEHHSVYKYRGTNYQRMNIEFHLPEGVNTGNITLRTEGEGSVKYDDVKVWKHTTVEESLVNPDYVVYEDFENVYEGYGLFELAQNSSMRTHITTDRSNPNDNNPVVEPTTGDEKQVGPVMTWVLDGENSLKSCEEAVISLTTNEGSVKLKKNNEYEVSFIYTKASTATYIVSAQSTTTGKVLWTETLEDFVNNGKSGKTENDYKTFTKTFNTGDVEDCQIVVRLDAFEGPKEPTETKALILDNFGIRDLTKSPEQPTQAPTQEPEQPTAVPTQKPEQPTAVPTQAPTQEPGQPTAVPTQEPGQPTAVPTQAPTQEPGQPTAVPTQAPTQEPGQPTAVPTQKPEQPTAVPTQKPTAKPTEEPNPVVTPPSSTTTAAPNGNVVITENTTSKTETTTNVTKDENKTVTETKVQVTDKQTGLVTETIIQKQEDKSGSVKVDMTKKNSDIAVDASVVLDDKKAVVSSDITVKPSETETKVIGQATEVRVVLAETVMKEVTEQLKKETGTALNNELLQIKVVIPQAEVIKQMNANNVGTAVIAVNVPKANSTFEVKNIILPASVISTAKASNTNLKTVVRNSAKEFVATWSFKQNVLNNTTAVISDVNLGVDVSTVSGATSQKQDIKDIVTQDKNNTTQGAIMLSFENNKQLPSAATVNVAVAGHSNATAGDKLYLYVVNKATKKLEAVPNNVYQVSEAGNVPVNIIHGTDYVLLPKQPSASVSVSLTDQIAVTLDGESGTKKTISGTNKTVNMGVTLPTTVKQVGSFSKTLAHKAVTEAKVTYTSSNSKIASIKSNGTVTSKKAGKATITTTVTLKDGTKKVVKSVITVK